MTDFERRHLRFAPADVLREWAAGWSATPTRGGHVRWSHPSGALVFHSATPSDWRSWANHLRNLRRARLTAEARVAKVRTP